MAKRLRCYFGMHRWLRKLQEGKAYYVCADCGKDRDPYHAPPAG